MCAAMQNTLNNSMLYNNSRPIPWYAPDRRIRTNAAARQAIEFAQFATNGHGLDAELDEQMLFAALHTCAFRVARCTRSKRDAMGEREEWSRRWSDIRECIVKRNLGLAYTMLGRIGSADPDQDGRVSESMFGLFRAVERFNPWRGYRFSTYACNVIARGLMRHARREGRYRAIFPSQRDTSLQSSSRLPDSHVGLWVERLNWAIETNSGKLTDIEAKVLAHRFHFQGGRRLTFQEIGHIACLSKERVRQIQNAALKKLRGILEADPILQ